MVWPTFLQAWLNIFELFGRRDFDEVILEWFFMPDERRAQAPNPHLRTRPATMLTAIGLCVLIMIMQLMPEIQDMNARFSARTMTEAK